MRSLGAVLLYAGALLPHSVVAQGDDETTGPTVPIATFTNTEDLDFYTGTRTEEIVQETGPPTGPYSKYSSKITLSRPAEDTTSVTEDLSFTESLPSTQTTASNATTETTDKPEPTNTQPCNNHVELCTRKYSNITHVGCHNSPFVRPGNAGSNQELPVKTQLNDGVRFLQAQIQWPSGDGEDDSSSVPHFCHTSCDLLDAGPITDWLGEVTDWVSKHPYDVVTILLGNGNFSNPALYMPFIEESGILKYAYEAPYLPMALDDWPTLEHMILRGKRVVLFMDYKVDQQETSGLHDQFAHMWETPFNPTDRDFPCTVQRPPDLDPDAARKRLYLANHNLNVEYNRFGASLLLPAVALLNETNSATGYGSLGAAAEGCREDWGRAPNFLNVDYYNYGDPPGSVFEVAARMNNVTYDWNCCGKVNGAPELSSPAALLRTVLVSGGLAALAQLL
ncbi:hypothetical protein ACRE_044750 [Hapsidospora chrysogenum ATCC 11550]|uniref:Secreted protein-like protein n=1 Tax=Hapsidospora chrysogenum (strain ATCC 11550 / CBS 779.69 / DSM 880 / IAM 14645 / JCM 23072 / IMI 49137) TaxID=857340 RepID=A0A086T5U6_HAPC1|nr:hypothetical protein ACRE_044750 [Hapsidospora chrysogenum ATCC 11550]